MKHRRDHSNNNRSGFSLVEIVISLFVLALFTASLLQGLSYLKITAEDNLYEGTAVTVAVSTLEQMKGASLAVIENPPTNSDGKRIFTMIVENANEYDLILDEVNTMTIPIVTKEDGTVANTMELEVTPSIDRMSTATGYWLTVRYSYKRPRTRGERTAVFRNALSTVQSY